MIRSIRVVLEKLILSSEASLSNKVSSLNSRDKYAARTLTGVMSFLGNFLLTAIINRCNRLNPIPVFFL